MRKLREVCACDIGAGAQNVLAEADIRLYGGVTDLVDCAVESLPAGTLQFVPDISCSHHGHGAGHACGDHGCKKPPKAE